MIFKRYSLYSFMKSVELVAIGVVPFVQKVVMIFNFNSMRTRYNLVIHVSVIFLLFSV